MYSRYALYKRIVNICGMSLKRIYAEVMSHVLILTLLCLCWITWMFSCNLLRFLRSVCLFVCLFFGWVSLCILLRRFSLVTALVFRTLFTYRFICPFIQWFSLCILCIMAIYSCGYTCVLKNVYLLFWTAVVRVCVFMGGCVCVWGGVCYSPLLHNSILCNHKNSNESNEKICEFISHFSFDIFRTKWNTEDTHVIRFTVKIAAQLTFPTIPKAKNRQLYCNVEFGTLLYAHLKSYIPLLF